MDTKFSESIIFNKNNITKFLERMKEYNYCDQTLVLQEKNLNNFKQFVEANNIEKIDLDVFSLFIKYRFNASIKESKKSIKKRAPDRSCPLLSSFFAQILLL